MRKLCIANLTAHFARHQTRDIESKTVATHAPKVSKGRRNSASSFPEPIFEAFKMRDKLAVLNAYHRFEV